MGVLSVRELNANISKALARVEAGETIDVAKNGKVFAEIRPKSRSDNAAWRKAHKDSVNFMRKGLDLGGGKISEADKYGDAEL